MKLLLITGEYPPVRTGDASHAFHIARHLGRRGVEVDVLTSRIAGAVRDPAFRTHPVMRDWSWAALPRFRRFLKRLRPDAVLHVFNGRMYGHHPMMTFAPTVAKRLLPGVRYVTQIEYPGRRGHGGRLWTRLVRKGVVWRSGRGVNYEHGTLLRDSDHLIMLSSAFRDLLVEDFSPDEDPVLLDRKSVLIPPPPLLAMNEYPEEEARARGRALLGVGPDEFLFMYFGYVYPGKGIETLLPAFQSVGRSWPKARLALVGGPGDDPFQPGLTAQNRAYWDAAQGLASSLGVADRVVWTGPCDAEDTRGSLYLRAADVCVLPLVGGVHLNNSSFAAAASHGLPVVTTRRPDTEAEFVDGENAALCPPEDADGLARVMERFITDRGFRDRLREGARDFAREWFSWDRAMDRTLATLGAVEDVGPLTLGVCGSAPLGRTS